MIDQEPKDIREIIRQWILQNRLELSESLPRADPDIASLVLTSLKDSDIELLAEMTSLREAGFDEEQTALMMADRHKKAMKAVTTFQERYTDIQDSMKPKAKPTKKPRRSYTRKAAPTFQV